MPTHHPDPTIEVVLPYRAQGLIRDVHPAHITIQIIITVTITIIHRGEHVTVDHPGVVAVQAAQAVEVEAVAVQAAEVAQAGTDAYINDSYTNYL